MVRLWRSHSGALVVGIALALAAWMLIAGMAYVVLRYFL